MVLFAALRNIRKNNISSKKMKEGFYMEELISKEELLKNVLKFMPKGRPDNSDFALNDEMADYCASLVQTIEDAPTIEKRKHGHWEYSHSVDGDLPYCSECLKVPKSGLISEYCPHCGAIMAQKPSVWNGQYCCPTCSRLFGNKIDIDSDLKFKEQTKKCSCGQHLIWDFRESEQNEKKSKS